MVFYRPYEFSDKKDGRLKIKIYIKKQDVTI